MWLSIAPADIQQAKEQLAARHAEILARHADEIQRLDAEEAQIDDLAQLVEAFIEKFKAPPPAPAIFAARPRQPGEHHPATSLAVAGFDRAVLPAGVDPRLTLSGAVSIDFHRSGSKSPTG